VCLSARWVVEADADFRDSVQFTRMVSSRNGPKRLSRRRSFLSVIAMRFSDSGQARTSQKVKAFSILRHPQDPLLSFPLAETSPFFRSPTQSSKSPASSIRLDLLCVLCTYAVQVSFTWRLVLSYLLHLRVLRHSLSFLQPLASYYRTHKA
jgi:hypothetical protein